MTNRIKSVGLGCVPRPDAIRKHEPDDRGERQCPQPPRSPPHRRLALPTPADSSPRQNRW